MVGGARKARPSHVSKTNNQRNLKKPAAVTLASSKVVSMHSRTPAPSLLDACVAFTGESARLWQSSL